MRRWEKKLDKAMRMEKEVEPPLKTFNPVNKNLIILYWAGLYGRPTVISRNVAL